MYDNLTRTNLEFAYQKAEKRIEELERKLERTEKDLADYQFNYPKIKDLEQENTGLKDLIKNIIRVTWGEGWNYSLDWKVKAEQFLEEME